MKKRILISLMLLLIGKLVLAQKQEPRLVLPVGHTDYVRFAQFSPDDKLVLSQGDDQTVRLHDVLSGKELQILCKENGYIISATFTADGKNVLVVTEDNIIRSYDILSGKNISEVEINLEHDLLNSTFSLDRKFFAATCWDSITRLWEVKSGRVIRSFSSQIGRFISVDISDDGKFILTAGEDSLARIWDIGSGKEIISFNGHNNLVSNAIFSPNGKLVVTWGKDSTIRIWSAEFGNELKRISTNYISDPIFNISRDNKLLFISDYWDTSAYICQLENFNLTKIKCQINEVAFSHDSKFLVISNDTSLSLHDAKTGKWIRHLGHGLKLVNSITFNSDGQYIAVTLDDNTVRLIDIHTGTEAVKLCGSTGSLISSGISPDGTLVFTTGDGELYVYEAQTGMPIWYIKDQNGLMYSAEWSPNGRYLLTIVGHPINKVIVCESLTGNKVLEFTGHKDHLMEAKWSPDGTKIISAGMDSIAYIRSVDSTNRYTSLLGHHDGITSVNFSPNGKMALTTSYDSTAILFDVNSGKIINKYSNHNKEVRYGVFSPDGRKILIVSDDFTSILYNIDSNHLENITFKDEYMSEHVFSKDGRFLLSTDDFQPLSILRDLYENKILFRFGEKSNIKSKSYSMINFKTMYKNNLKDYIRISRFSPDEKILFTINPTNSISLYNASSGVEQHHLVGHSDIIRSAKFSPDGSKIISSGRDHKTILWDVATGKPLYTRLELKGEDWLVYDTNYRFDGTPGAIEKLYFVCGLEVVELNQVKDSLYVPNLVQRIMNGENLDRLPKLSDLNICGVTPIVEPIEKGDGGYHYEVTPQTGGVGDIEIYLNGVVRQTENAKRLKLKNGKYSIQVDPKLIERYQVPGESLQVKVIAKTANNSISSRGIVIDLKSDEPTSLRKPSLHAVMIGVDDYKDDNLDLNYAAKDANDLHQALEQASKKFFNVDDTNRVFFYNLTVDRNSKIGTDKIKAEMPDKVNIIKTLEEIEKKSKPEDILLVFFAGHGEIVDKDQLLLLTTEATSTNFEGIRMRELLDQLNKIPAGKRVLILDACHSGAAINNLDYAQLTGKRDVKDAERQSQRLKELDKLASKSGFAIITASSSDQKALELPQYEHGLMTYALLNAMLNNKRSLDENNQLQLEKWLIATEEEVKKLNQNQSAERMVPVTFTLGKIDDEVRSSIVLKEIPTVFVSNVLNIDLGFDDQKIKGQLINYFSEKSRGTEKTLFVSEIEQPNSVQVNVVYTISTNQITFKATLLKNNEVVKRIEKSGNLTTQSSLLNELMVMIEKELG